MKQKKSVWIKLASEDLLRVMTAMDYQAADQIRVQRKRVFLSVIVFSVLFSVGVLTQSLVLMVLSPFAAFGAWLFSAEEVKRAYRRFQFKRQYDYNKFREKLLPMLHSRKNNLYRHLQKLYGEQPEGRVKEALGRFMISLTEKPNQVGPFLQFADEASGTEEARTFMQTLFDFQQNTDDTEVLDAMSLQASEELFRGVDDISKMKLQRLMLFPSYFTMTVLIPILWFLGLFIWHQWSELSLW